MSREEELQQLKDASRQMVENKTWPVTEDELINYHSSSFEFGFACGALWEKERLALTWEDIRLIDTIASKLLVSHGNLDDECFFKEVLKRFKYFKERKENGE